MIQCCLFTMFKHSPQGSITVFNRQMSEFINARQGNRPETLFQLNDSLTMRVHGGVHQNLNWF